MLCMRRMHGSQNTLAEAPFPNPHQHLLPTPPTLNILLRAAKAALVEMVMVGS